MSSPLTASQVESLAPDASSLAAARKLARPAPWQNLGRSADALWGECQGSAVYQTQVALADLGHRCSCPSRKQPCKHVLGLMLLAANAPDSLTSSAVPEWVAAFHARREAERARRAAPRASNEGVADPAAKEKRARQREQKILRGLEQLDVWMSDLVKQGLGRAAELASGVWDQQARRLVDAQAPGVAARVRRMGEQVGVGDDWTVRLLDALGSVALLTHAYRRLEQLDLGLAADVRRLVGITLDESEVIAHGDLSEDVWRVLSDGVEEDERGRIQRAWLRGGASGRLAMVQQFALRTARFEHALSVGQSFTAKLAFFPSAAPQRALIVGRGGFEASEALPEGDDVDAALDRFAALLAACPWVDATLLVLRDVVPVRGEIDLLVDGRGSALPLASTRYDGLFALSGGAPIVVSAEWDGYLLTPRAVWTSDGVAHRMERDA